MKGNVFFHTGHESLTLAFCLATRRACTWVPAFCRPQHLRTAESLGRLNNSGTVLGSFCFTPRTATRGQARVSVATLSPAIIPRRSGRRFCMLDEKRDRELGMDRAIPRRDFLN